MNPVYGLAKQLHPRYLLPGFTLLSIASCASQAPQQPSVAATPAFTSGDRGVVTPTQAQAAGSAFLAASGDKFATPPQFSTPQINVTCTNTAGISAWPQPGSPYYGVGIVSVSTTAQAALPYVPVFNKLPITVNATAVLYPYESR